MNWIALLTLVPTLAALITQLLRGQITAAHFAHHLLDTIAQLLPDPDAAAALQKQADMHLNQVTPVGKAGN
jgi:hypothetical protein